MTDQSSQPPDSGARMFQLIIGFMATPAISVAASLGIADLVAETPKTADELAQATKTHTPSLRRLLQFLTSLGVFAEDAAGRYGQTPLSDTLRSDHPQSFRGGAILFGSEFQWRPWADLRQTISTGKAAFDHVFGATFFNYLAAHPDDAAIFNAGMTSTSSVDLAAILAVYDFSGFERIVDVGGGQGALIHGILSANPKVRGVLFDLPSVVAGATVLRSGAIAERCEVVGGDFFHAVPQGANAYVMRVVLHDWNDQDALKILVNCRRATPPGGKLLLIESVLKPPNEPDPGRFNDLVMLVLAPGGRERTEAEFRGLLREAGFSLTRVIPATGITSIIESQPV